MQAEAQLASANMTIIAERTVAEVHAQSLAELSRQTSGIACLMRGACTTVVHELSPCRAFVGAASAPPLQCSALRAALEAELGHARKQLEASDQRAVAAAAEVAMLRAALSDALTVRPVGHLSSHFAPLVPKLIRAGFSAPTAFSRSGGFAALGALSARTGAALQRDA